MAPRLISPTGVTVRVDAETAKRLSGYKPAPERHTRAPGPVHPEGDPSQKWKVAELVAYAEANDVELDGATSKADILAALAEAADAADAGGQPVGDGDSTSGDGASGAE